MKTLSRLTAVLFVASAAFLHVPGTQASASAAQAMKAEVPASGLAANGLGLDAYYRYHGHRYSYRYHGHYYNHRRGYPGHWRYY